MKTVANQFNNSAIVELYDSVDFIGISSYSGERRLTLVTACHPIVRHAAGRCNRNQLGAAHATLYKADGNMCPAHVPLQH
jgi:hypothetical protein